MPMDILWLHTRSLRTYLWIFCGYIYEVYRHACGYSVVAYTKFTDMPMDILWLQLYQASENTCIDCVIARTLFYKAFKDSVGRMNEKCASRIR
jgi:hypothetical protein